MAGVGAYAGIPNWDNASQLSAYCKPWLCISALLPYWSLLYSTAAQTIVLLMPVLLTFLNYNVLLKTDHPESSIIRPILYSLDKSTDLTFSHGVLHSCISMLRMIHIADLRSLLDWFKVPG